MPGLTDDHGGLFQRTRTKTVYCGIRTNSTTTKVSGFSQIIRISQNRSFLYILFAAVTCSDNLKQISDPMFP